ncbi:MAG: Flp family type IVb pilin [Rhodanobacter sp.]
MNTSIRKFLAEEDGITALEYGILAAIVAAAIVAVFGTDISALYTSIFSTLDAAVPTTKT